MYGKLFASMYEGTLYGHWQAIVTFQQMIVLCDADGLIDMTPQALAARTSIPLEIIEQGLKILEEPDKWTRTPGEEGRRIARLDEHRPWGWRIVNYHVYRDLVAMDDKRKADRERIAAKREESRNVSHGVAERRFESRNVANVAHAEAEAEACKSKTPPKRGTVTAGIPFPEDLCLDEPMRQQALKRASDCDPEVAFEQFRAHHVAHGSRLKNWRAAWVTWTGNFRQFGYPKHVKGGDEGGWA